jgi:hypothetical protein
MDEGGVGLQWRRTAPELRKMASGLMQAASPAVLGVGEEHCGVHLGEAITGVSFMLSGAAYGHGHMRMELKGRRRDPVVVQELGWVRFGVIKEVKEIEEVKGKSTEGKTGAGNLLWRRNRRTFKLWGGRLRRDRVSALGHEEP